MNRHQPEAAAALNTEQTYLKPLDMLTARVAPRLA
jgi:hypothetical protein